MTSTPHPIRPASRLAWAADLLARMHAARLTREAISTTPLAPPSPPSTTLTTA
ncbi:hypothetical protein DEIPH_ctg052orf0051 [Deinococcus phoenicis]|uniref:Uncharacterized protein n=1 Tax=Deinococcus phoenicis TaxID=1476583 RepID=A0A016QLZ9_9DEIO|nr:hypothetical protein [Deinococcus phoenicis]EYB67053.1 hypothetical protein DEIPH_ctg052orf0051 [Deinococcus phoenicis]